MRIRDSQKWIVLDALWRNRVDFDSIFAATNTFEELFNIPWHGLSAAECCHVTAELIEREYVIVTTKNDARGAYRVLVGLTPKGGALWFRRFVNNLDLFIEDFTWEEDGNVILEFTGTDKGILMRLRESICGTCCSDLLSIGSVKSTGAWEFTDWMLVQEAYAFRIVAASRKWLDSAGHQQLLDEKIALSRGWRKPPLRLDSNRR